MTATTPPRGRLRPRPLREGSALRVVTASSPFERERFEQGLALLEGRYRVSLAEGLFARRGFLAGRDEQRAEALCAALTDDSEALVAARGGYGATRILPLLSLDAIASARKWLVGFSDVTALHAQWARAGLCSLHAPMVCSLAAGSERSQRAFFEVLEGGAPPDLLELETWCAGSARGTLAGGNLTTLCALLGTPYAPSYEGSIVLLEDIGERPYRIDRMLISLRQSGALSGVRGVVLGQFTDCHPGPDGTRAEDVLREGLEPLGVPVLANAPVGHVEDNLPMLLGAEVELAAGALRYV